MADVLLVSKPVVPPWNDSSKNLVRDLARALRGHRAHVMVPRGAPDPGLGDAALEPIYAPAAGRFSPPLVDNLRVLAHLTGGRRADLWHFFFAPNPRTSTAARVASGLRRVPTVQTVCSVPAESVDLAGVLFADRVVVLSRHTEARFLAAGIAPSRLRRIPPAIALPETRPGGQVAVRSLFSLPVDAPLIVYPGDLEFGGGARRSLDLLEDLRVEFDPILAIACRTKTPRAAVAAERLRRTVIDRGLADRVHFIGETPHIHALLQAADLVLLPSETTYAKMDLPLVLIEAMALGRAALVADDTPAEELAEGDAARAVPLRRDAIHATAAGLLRDDAARVALGQRAVGAVQARFVPEPMAAAYAALYDELGGG